MVGFTTTLLMLGKASNLNLIKTEMPLNCGISYSREEEMKKKQRKTYLCKCGDEIEKGRFDLFLRDNLMPICLTCGWKAANIEIAAKKTRVAPETNKQGVSYLGDPAIAKKKMLDVGRKDGLSMHQNPTFTTSIVRIAPKPRIKSGQILGRYREGGDWIAIYSPQKLEELTKAGKWVVKF